MSKSKTIKVVTGLVRFTNVHLHKPASLVEGSPPRCSVTLIVPKSDTKTLEDIKKAYAQVLELNKRMLSNKSISPSCLRDGDVRKDDPIYLESYFLNASSSEKPGIVDIDLNPLIDVNDVYNGCYGRASITLFPYVINGRGGIGVGLNNIQKIKDGEPSQKPVSDFAVNGGEHA